MTAQLQVTPVTLSSGTENEKQEKIRCLLFSFLYNEIKDVKSICLSIQTLKKGQTLGFIHIVF